MNHHRWISCALLGLVIALSQYGCAGDSGPQPAQSEPPASASAPTIHSPVPETPSPGPTSTIPPAISTDPRPGWTWYRNDAYSIAYPQQWLSKPVGGFPYDFSAEFISPETETSVIVTVLESLGGTDWLEWLRKQKGVSYPSTMVSANATFHGIPAFFFFDPGALQTGDIVRLYFEDRDRGWMYRITFRCMPSMPYAAENAIFTQMLNSFSLGKQDGPTTFPIDWANGDTLIAYLPDSQNAALDTPLDITGVLSDYSDPVTGSYAFQSDTGEAVNAFMAFAHLFQGTTIDYSGPSPRPDFNPGDPIRVIGTKTSAGKVDAHIVYQQDAAHNWEIRSYRSLFDLDQQPPPPELLKYYPLDGSASLWLYSSTIDRLLPYLVTKPEAIRETPISLPALAQGRLRGAGQPVMDLEALYVQKGPCVTLPFEGVRRDFTAYIYPVRYCYNWQQVYPAPVSILELTGTVLNASETDHIIVLQTPVDGFVALTPSADVVVNWSQLASGTIVRVKGQPGEAGTLVISQIEIGPPG